MTNLIALKSGTELVGDYRIERVLGAGGFGITYLAHEIALGRDVTIKEYFPSDFAVRGEAMEAAPRSENCSGDYTWGLDRFIDEAKTLGKFNHPNIVRVYRYFKANATAYMVLHFEEGQSLKSWLKSLGRAPRQKELDAVIAPLLDALEVIHKADFLHRDIAPDNIIIRKDGAPVLIDFGSARGEIAAHSKTVSALVKPGYSPYEQYAETGKQQGPWTDIYALGSTLYHAVTGKRPPDAPSRMVKDDFVSAREAAVGAFRPGFLKAIDRALLLNIDQRPQSIAAWRGDLLAPEPKPASWLARTLAKDAAGVPDAPHPPLPATPPVPDAPGPQGRLLDFVDNLKGDAGQGAASVVKVKTAAPPPKPDLPAPIVVSSGTRKLDAADHAPLLPRILRRKSAQSGVIDARAAAPVEARKSAPTAVAIPRVFQRAPAPKRIKTARGGWKPLAFKLLIGVGVASGAVALQDQMPRVESRGASLNATATTGSITPVAAQPIAPVSKLSGHSGSVTALAYANIGRTIVTIAKDATLKVWNAPSASLARTIELDDGPASALAVSGTRAVTGHANGTIVMWDIETAHKIASFKRNDAEVWSLAFLGGPERFAAASHDWKVAVWDASAPGAPSHVLDAHESSVQAVSYGAMTSGPVLATGGADKAVKLWNLETLERVRTHRGHRDFITAVAIAEGGKDLASSSLDGNVRIWSARSGRLTRSLSGHKGRANALAFAPSGDVLASAGEDGKIRIWEFKRRRTPKTLPSHAGSVTAVAFSPDGQHIASAGDDGLVRIWDNPLSRPVTN